MNAMDVQGGTRMAKQILDDSLWTLMEPILPKPKPRRFRFPGRKPIGNREALTGILFVLQTGIPWEYLPQEMGCGSGMTCWRRLRDWQRAGVWEKLHRLLLSHLREADKIDWSRAIVDSASVRAVFGGHTPDPTLRIAAKKARSIMSSLTPTASPWRPRSQQPIAMI
jgi:transposase